MAAILFDGHLKEMVIPFRQKAQGELLEQFQRRRLLKITQFYTCI